MEKAAIILRTSQ